jgi:TfoX/Sxy family transcriptional regulator of competence genes
MLAGGGTFDMAYDETVANRVRQALSKHGDFDERRMFGGLAFMVRGHMCCGVVGSELMVRVGPEGHAKALALPHAREMDFTGRPLTGMVYVAAAGFNTAKALDAWVGRGLAFVPSLPVKEPKSRLAKPRRRG